MPMPTISNCLSRSGSKDLTTEVMREAKVKELLDPGLKLLEQNGWALNNMFILGEPSFLDVGDAACRIAMREYVPLKSLGKPKST